MQSELKVEGVDWNEAGKYLTINLSPNEISELKLDEVVSKRKRAGGRKPGITTAEVMGKLYREEGEDVASLFNPPERSPNEQEKKVILNQVIKIATLLAPHPLNLKLHGLMLLRRFASFKTPPLKHQSKSSGEGAVVRAEQGGCSLSKLCSLSSEVCLCQGCSVRRRPTPGLQRRTS